MLVRLEVDLGDSSIVFEDADVVNSTIHVEGSDGENRLVNSRFDNCTFHFNKTSTLEGSRFLCRKVEDNDPEWQWSLPTA